MVQGVSRAFPARPLQAQWCHPVVISDFAKTPADTETSIEGLLYVKSHKASSSTCAAVNNHIAHQVGKRNFVEPGFKNSTTSMQEKCRHFDVHKFSMKKFHARRNPEKSLLWTFVRHPQRRDLSEFYHFTYSRNPSRWENATADAMIDLLQMFKSRQTRYLSPSRRIEFSNDWKEWRHKDDESFLNGVSNLLREDVLDFYDFIGVTERMMESLAVMTFLFDLEPTDMIVLSAKQTNGPRPYDGGGGNKCIKIHSAPATLAPAVDKWLREEHKEANLDYLLYASANASLDRTIELLGVSRVKERVKLLNKLQSVAEQECQDIAVFPCSTEGVPQEASKESCYLQDSGCGHACVEAALSKYLNS